MYKVDYTIKALEGLIKIRKSEPAHYKKVMKLLEELSEHPTTGTGHPEQLKGFETPTWSRRISQKHRLVYEVHDKEIKVLVLLAYGHYD